MKPNRTIRLWLTAFCCTFFVMFFSSCDPDSELSGTDINGFWIVNETITDNCSGSTETSQQTEIFSVEQKENTLIITLYPNGDCVSGTIQNSTVTWEGSIPSGSGQLDIDFTGMATSNGNEMSGTADWQWHSDSYQCSGTSFISGNKVLEETVNFEGDWSGEWESEEYMMEGTFSASVTQSDNLLSGTIHVPEIGIIDANLEGIVNGNVVYFGDISGIIRFVGLQENGSAHGTYSFMSSIDEGTWIAEKE